MDTSDSQSTCDEAALDLTRVFAEFILKLRDGYNLTQIVVNNIIQDMTDLFDRNIEVLAKSITIKLKQDQHFSEQAISSITDRIKASCFSSSLQQLKSEYLQNSYFKRKLGLIVWFISFNSYDWHFSYTYIGTYRKSTWARACTNCTWKSN